MYEYNNIPSVRVEWFAIENRTWSMKRFVFKASRYNYTLLKLAFNNVKSLKSDYRLL
jgi:hypothetical protein